MGHTFFRGPVSWVFPEQVSYRFHTGFMGYETTPVSWHETMTCVGGLVSCLVSCLVSHLVSCSVCQIDSIHPKQVCLI